LKQKQQSKNPQIVPFPEYITCRSTFYQRFLLLLLIFATPLAAQQPTVNIGVLAFNGEQQAQDRWRAIADYLTARIPGYRFRILPLTHEAFRNRIRKGQLDFILTNPAHYVRLEVSFGATRIATFKNRFRDQALTHFAAVIFTHANSGLQRLEDLPGHSLAAVNEEAFGGFLLARKRLLDEGIDALHDLTPLWLGFPQSDIVKAVLEGRADVGTVRSGVLESMATSGQIDMSRVRILSRRSNKRFPLLHSTDLYPEWPFARLPHTDERLAKAVAITLLQMPEDSPPALAAGGAGWTIPLDYSGVHQILRQLRIEPYTPQPMTLEDLWKSYQLWLILLALAFVAVALAIVFTLRINRKLKQSQRELTRHRNQLEHMVAQRTQALIDANAALKQDIEFRIQYEEALQGGCECLQSFHGVITRGDLTREQRLQSILDLMRQYFAAEQVLLTRVEAQGLVYCTASPPLPGASQALAPELAQRALSENRVLEDTLQPDGHGHRHRYLACPVQMNGQVACLIEFLSPPLTTDESAPRLSVSNELSMRLLQLMGQWLGYENHAKRQDDERSRAASRLSSLTPREREVLQHLAAGESNKVMARALGISIKTVELHRSNLLRKAGVSGSIELTCLAMRAGLVDTPAHKNL